MSDQFCTPLNLDQIEQNFAEINPAMSPAEALVEANRCLYCYDAPCMHACPTHIDVPGFIKKIASGNLIGSARVIFDANPIGATGLKGAKAGERSSRRGPIADSTS